jgi:hypothetical protein
MPKRTHQHATPAPSPGDREIGAEVRVTWLDHACIAEWHDSAEREYALRKFRTHGTVIESHEDRLVVASTIGDGCVGDVNIIGRAMITEIHVYSEGTPCLP